MSKILISNSTEGIVISKKITRPEAVIEWELKMINSNEISQIIPLLCDEKKRDIILEAHSYSNYTLKDYFYGVIGKRMFLEVVLNLIQIVKKCEEKMLNATNLWLNYDAIFVNRTTGEIRCIYWPIVNNRDECSIAEFFQNLPNNFELYQGRNARYLAEYHSYFEHTAPFSLKTFERLILQLSNQVEHEDELSSVKVSFESEHIESIDVEKRNVAYDPLSYFQTNIPNAAKEQSLFNNKDIQSVTQGVQEVFENEEYKVAETSVLSLNGDIDKMLNQTCKATPHSSRVILRRQKNGEQIVILKPKYVIGRSKFECDYSILGNSAISRVHLVICQDSMGKVTVSDNKSRNGSKLNGGRLQPNENYEVRDGDVLTLADENFVFVLS